MKLSWDWRNLSRITERIRRPASLAMPRLELFVLLLLALLGVGLRLRQYLFNRSFWLDEASLASNIVNHDVLTLLTVPLEYHQSAPPGFLVAVRSMVVTVGPFDWALRLVPLIAGLSVIILAVVLARRELTSTVARLTFVGLVAMSPILIFYSSEFKQYSSDALAALAILLAVSFRSSRNATWLLAGTGFVALICSLPAVFVAAPAGLLLLFEAVRSHRYKPLLFVGLAWAIGAGLHGAYILQAGVDREYMVTWWSESETFPPFPPHSLADLLWYPRAVSGFTFLVFRNAKIAAPGLKKEFFDFLGWALALAFVVSLAMVFVSRRPICIVAAGAILLTGIASAFELYPFSSRLLIFLVPFALLIFAAAIDDIDIKVGPLVAGSCALWLFSVMAPIVTDGLITPRFQTDLKGALLVVKQNSISGDALAMEARTERIFDLYKDSKAPKLPTFVVDKQEAARSLIERVEREGYHRVWFVEVRPVYPSAVDLIDEVARTAPILSTWQTRGTRLVLFDFRPKSQ